MGGVSDAVRKELGRIKLPMIDTYSFHRPVLLSQVISYLRVSRNEKYIDATVGGGGYTEEILEKGGVVLGIDQDPEAIKFVGRKFGKDKQIFLEEGNFANIKSIARKYGFEKVSGVIFDLGMSSYQIDQSGRGFSWKKDEELDMRMSKREEVKAKDLLNKLPEEQLYEIFSSFSEELNSRAIAHAVFRARALRRFERTRDLVNVVNEVLGTYDPKVLARIFQAIRIAVNNELESLKRSLAGSLELLIKGGRLVVLSYHSLEDRLVKQFLAEEEKRLLTVTKRPITADYKEIKSNSRSRSVKLRCAKAC